MTFKDWLSYFKEVNLPIGDLAKDVAHDGKFPDTKDYEKINDYLQNEARASRAATDTFEKAYAFYADSFGLKYNSEN